MENKELVRIYKEHIEPQEIKIKLGKGKNEFNITATENVTLSDVDVAIDVITGVTVDNDFDYSLVDPLIAYYILKLFTDIPFSSDESDEDLYTSCNYCFNILNKFDLMNVLSEHSPIIAGYISYLVQNVWRTLDYKKSIRPYEGIMNALAQFYEIMEELENMANQQKDIDVDEFINQINEIASGLKSLENDRASSELKIVENKTKDTKDDQN